MKLPSSISLFLLASSSILPLSANEYKFEEIKFDQVENKQDIYEPKDKLDEYIIKAATYSTKFVPLMNQGAEGSEYTDLMFSDGKRILADAGYDFVNSTANSSIQSTPFFAQTSVNISGGTESDTSFSLNSLMKLGELAKDDEGDIKTLAFSQARLAAATNAEGSTTNLGLGIRHRQNDVSMLGANAFWDYKNTQDNSGLEGSVSWQATPHIGLEAYVSNEISAASTTRNSDLPGTDETFFGLRMNLTGTPVTFDKKDYKKNMITQMIQPVKRKYDVLLERSNNSFTNRAKGS